MEEKYSNSILDSMTKNAAVAEVSQYISDAYRIGKCYFFVEGDDDEKICKRLYQGDYECAILGGHNHTNVILSSLSPTLGDKFIIIKDADFEHLNNRPILFENLILTDKHDLETTLLAGTFFSVLHDKYSEYYSDVATLRNDLLKAIDDIIHLSYIKWYANLAPTFGATRFSVRIKVGSCYNGRDIVPICAWLTRLQSLKDNLHSTICSESAIMQFEQTHSCDDMLQLVNGHNMLEAFNRKLTAACGRCISKDDLLKDMIQSYTIDEYKQTQMYARINAWLKKYGHKVWL